MKEERKKRIGKIEYESNFYFSFNTFHVYLTRLQTLPLRKKYITYMTKLNRIESITYDLFIDSREEPIIIQKQKNFKSTSSKKETEILSKLT